MNTEETLEERLLNSIEFVTIGEEEYPTENLKIRGTLNLSAQIEITPKVYSENPMMVLEAKRQIVDMIKAALYIEVILGLNDAAECLRYGDTGNSLSKILDLMRMIHYIQYREKT